MIDVVITTYNRIDLLRQTVESFVQKNTTIPYRLVIIDDLSDDGTAEYLLELRKRKIADVYLNSQRHGVVFGLDMLWTITDFFDFFFSENLYLCYLQDDLVSKIDNWLLIAIRAYEALKEEHNIGFFSGHDAPEHPVTQEIRWENNTLYLKKSQGATNLIGEKSFWRSVNYIPRFNPDGTARGFPNSQRGSHVDIWLTGCYSGSRFHRTNSSPTSLYRQGKNLLVLPDLLEHLGQPTETSTWRGNRFASAGAKR